MFFHWNQGFKIKCYLIGFQSKKKIPWSNQLKKGRVLIASVFSVKSLSNIISFKTLVPLRQNLLLFFHNSKIKALVAIILPCVLKRGRKCSNASLTPAKHFIDVALKRYTDQMHEEASRGKQWQSTLLQYPPAVNHRQGNCYGQLPWWLAMTTFKHNYIALAGLLEDGMYPICHNGTMNREPHLHARCWMAHKPGSGIG